MKTISIALWLLCVSLSGIHAQIRAPLRITVDKEQKTKQDIKQQAQARQEGNVIYHKPQVTERNREIVMNIKLQNLGATPMTGLAVKYVVFARDRQTRAIRPAGNGEQTVDVKPLETKVVKTDPVEFESEDVNYTQGYFSDMNRSRGKDYYGIAVTVFAGNDKIAGYFNPPALEKVSEKIEEEKQETEKPKP